ncbi:MAG: peptidylprolyl isomerase [Clostridia bacterium]|nr:peptidylprolyl isomerase [Clostridia bacterium]
MKKIIAFLLAVLMLVSFTACSSKTGGGDTDTPAVNTDQNHSLVALESENFKVTNGMLSYFYLTGFYSVYASYSSYFQSMGFDASKSLTEQQYTEDMSWHDYFLEMTLGDARNFLRVAEEAKKADHDDSYVADMVQEQIDLIVTSEGITIEEYITRMFGDTLDEQDIRDALALQIYAYDYYEKYQVELNSTITSEDCETYYSENTKSLSKVDYISYTVTASTANTDDTEAAYAEAQKKAQELVSETEANGVEGFKSWVTDYMTEQNKTSTTPLSDDDLSSPIEKLLAGTTGASYSEGDELSEFCFEDGRKTGDCKLTDNGAGSYTVTVVSKAAYRQEDITKNVRHILFKPENYDGSEDVARAKAEEVLAEWKAGEATVESYDALAQEYNDDNSSLYENVYQGEMVEPFNDWLFDPARVEGDTGIVQTDYGFHIMYFAGDGYPLWEVDVRNTLVTAKLGEAMTAFEAAYPVTETQESIDKLPSYIPESALETTSTQNVYE